MQDVTTPSERRRTYLDEGLWGSARLPDRVRRWAEQSPDALAVVDGSDGRRMTFAQLYEDACKVAAFLQEQGIRAGDTVGVQLPNRYETVAVDLGVLAAGGVLNPLLPNYRAKELRHILHASGSRALFTPSVYRGFDHHKMAQELLADLPGLACHVTVEAQRAEVAGWELQDVLDRQAADSLERAVAGHEVGADAVSEVIFTSGTEAAPKAVMHTEQTTNFAVDSAYEALGMSATDVVWMPSPVGHSTGLNYGLRMALYHGLPLVLQDRWDPELAASLIAAERCTYTLAATTFLSDLVRCVGEQPRDVSSLQRFGCGGAPVPPELVAAGNDLGLGVLRLYGSTEALVVAWNRPSSPPEKRRETDGLVMPHVEVEARDEDGAPCDPATPGELFVRGPQVSVGFFDDPERTASYFSPEGWVRSGDMCTVDSDRYVTVEGRKKEIIIRGGMNIAPREIEDLLTEFPEIRAAAAIGLPDERLGEIVCACLVLEEGAQAPTVEEVGAGLRRAGVAVYKLPERVQVVDELPRTPSGKVQKHILAERLRGEVRG